MQEESFGPVLPSSAGAERSAGSAANERKPIRLDGFRLDARRAARNWMARELSAGTIFQNRCDYLDPMLPWTGYGESGKGSTLSRYGFYHLTRRKSIHFRL